MTTLPTSNLTANAIHQATGGSSGSTVSLNDFEVRALADRETGGSSVSFDNLRGKIGIPKTNSGPGVYEEFLNRKNWYFWNAGTTVLGSPIPSATWSGVPTIKYFYPIDSGQVISGKSTVPDGAKMNLWFDANAYHEGWSTLTHSTVSGSVKRTGGFTINGVSFPAFPNPTNNGTYFIYGASQPSTGTGNFNASGLPSTSGPFPNYNTALS
tara:strand:+ start:894 stop:1526 length:633 start_codon:yes stop_codon:yes gene_type:complete